jgi:hypothetical protein
MLVCVRRKEGCVCVCVYKKIVNCRMGLTKTVGGFLCSGFLKDSGSLRGFWIR